MIEAIKICSTSRLFRKKGLSLYQKTQWRLCRNAHRPEVDTCRHRLLWLLYELIVFVCNYFHSNAPHESLWISHQLTNSSLGAQGQLTTPWYVITPWQRPNNLSTSPPDKSITSSKQTDIKSQSRLIKIQQTLLFHNSIHLNKNTVLNENIAQYMSLLNQKSIQVNIIHIVINLDLSALNKICV